MPQQRAARGGGLDAGSWLSVWLQLLSRLGSPSLVTTSAGTMGAQGTEGADCKQQSKATQLQCYHPPITIHSTVPASTLTAVTRYKCGQQGVMGRHTRSPPLPLQLWPAQQRRDHLLLCARRCGPLHIQLQWAHLLPIELTRAI